MLVDGQKKLSGYLALSAWLMIAPFLSNCGKSHDNNNPPVIVTGNEKIHIITSLFGGNAAFNAFTVTIDEQGNISQVTTDFNNNPVINQAGQITEPEMNDMRYLVIAANVFALNDRYECTENCPTDMPGTSLDVAVDGQTKRISFNTVPSDAVSALLRKIDELCQIHLK